MDTEAKLTGRCTVIVAAAGYGKTTAVWRWLGGTSVHWHADALPTALTAAEAAGADWVVLDDLGAVRGDELTLVLTQASRQLGAARVVLISRWPLALPASLRRQGTVEERTAADLALSAGETSELLRREYGLSDAAVAATVYELTAGWPALVHLAADQLATAPEVGGPGSGPATFLDKHVLTALPQPAARLVRDLAHLGTVDEDLCRALGHRRPERTLVQLARIGLIVPGERPADRRLVPLLAAAARDRWPLRDSERDRLFCVAGDWYAAHGRKSEAIEAFYRCGRTAASATMLREHGPTWVTAGGAATIAAAVTALPPEDRDPALRLLLGEALLVLGEDDRALAELSALAASCEAGDLPAELAWRFGAVHYLRGDPRAAAAAFARGRLAAEDTAAEAMLLAWDATASWMAGDTAGAEIAHRALQAAEAADDDRARATAHVALGMHAMLAGDRAGNAAHYDAALRYADAARDVVQAARIHANRSANLIEEGHYARALAEARRGKTLAEQTGYAAILAVALCNEADALYRVGRLDEAADSLQQALRVFQGKRSHKVAYPLIGLGAIHRVRGRHNLARAAYEEAARVATATGDIQGMVPALGGLARVLAGTDPAAATRQAALAHAAASGPFVTEALLATGWAQLGSGDREAAVASATEAAAQARRHRDSSGLAEALELRAAATTDPAEARRALREAAETLRLTGAPIDLDRVVVTLSALPDAEVTERVAGRLARERLDAAGVMLPAPVAVSARRGTAAPVVIRSFGRFEVSVGDTAVTMSMWQSRKARDLLRILVAKRGRAIARDELTELLWPGGEADRLGHRLSVALSTVRSVLDPDRAADTDHLVLADRSGVALEVGHLTIDLETFLVEAGHGLALRDRGQPDDARAVLIAAERLYTGDFLENEPYEDWSVATREEARATYLRIARALAELSRLAGRVDEAVHYLLKVLDKDPYDERGHRELVETLAAAGQYGEARRAQARYLAAMQEIGVTPR